MMMTSGNKTREIARRAFELELFDAFEADAFLAVFHTAAELAAWDAKLALAADAAWNALFDHFTN